MNKTIILVLICYLSLSNCYSQTLCDMKLCLFAAVDADTTGILKKSEILWFGYIDEVDTFLIGGNLLTYGDDVIEITSFPFSKKESAFLIHSFIRKKDKAEILGYIIKEKSEFILEEKALKYKIYLSKNGNNWDVTSFISTEAVNERFTDRNIFKRADSDIKIILENLDAEKRFYQNTSKYYNKYPYCF